MSLRAARVRALNSLLFIKDTGRARSPEIDGLGSVWSTPSCIAVGCLPDCDGATEVIVGDIAQAEEIGPVKIFEGTLETPSRALIVETVMGEKVLEQTVATQLTSIQIWNDGYRDSSKIVIGFS